MADYNRNERGSSRYSNEDWNDNRNRSGRYENDRNSGYGNLSQGFDEDDSGWQSRYERQDSNRMSNRGSTGYGRNTESDMNTGSWGSERGYGGYGSGSYGGSNYGSGYSSGGYGSGLTGSGRRNLYDRDYEGMNRSSYVGSRIGAGNYGSYGDRGRFNEGRGYSNYGGSNFGSNYGRQDYNRDYNRGMGDYNEERGWWDRTTDEVSSWFGDEDAGRRRERDRQMEGMHRGRGPKNYTRSDERIKDDINDRLSDDPYIDATEIDVAVNSGEVTLTGSVDHRSTKRRAEDVAEAVSGVKNVENRIRVTETSTISGSGSEDTSRSSTSTSAVPGSERSRSKGHYVTG